MKNCVKICLVPRCKMGGELACSDIVSMNFCLMCIFMKQGLAGRHAQWVF